MAGDVGWDLHPGVVNTVNFAEQDLYHALMALRETETNHTTLKED